MLEIRLNIKNYIQSILLHLSEFYWKIHSTIYQTKWIIDLFALHLWLKIYEKISNIEENNFAHQFDCAFKGHQFYPRSININSEKKIDSFFPFFMFHIFTLFIFFSLLILCIIFCVLCSRFHRKIMFLWPSIGQPEWWRSMSQCMAGKKIRTAKKNGSLRALPFVLGSLCTVNTDKHINARPFNHT